MTDYDHTPLFYDRFTPLVIGLIVCAVSDVSGDKTSTEASSSSDYRWLIGAISAAATVILAIVGVLRCWQSRRRREGLLEFSVHISIVLPSAAEVLLSLSSVLPVSCRHISKKLFRRTGRGPIGYAFFFNALKSIAVIVRLKQIVCLLLSALSALLMLVDFKKRCIGFVLCVYFIVFLFFTYVHKTILK